MASLRPDNEPDPILVAKPDPDPNNPAQLAFPPPGFQHTSIHVGPKPDSPLVVPPELLTRLSSEQISTVLEIAKNKSVTDGQVAISKASGARAQERGVRWLAAFALTIVGTTVLVAVLRDRFDWAKEILVPIATGLAGYLAGRGHERIKK